MGFRAGGPHGNSSSQLGAREMSAAPMSPGLWSCGFNALFSRSVGCSQDPKALAGCGCRPAGLTQRVLLCGDRLGMGMGESTLEQPEAYP